MALDQLGAKLGLAAASVQAWETGTAEPDADQTRRLNGIFGTLARF